VSALRVEHYYEDNIHTHTMAAKKKAKKTVKKAAKKTAKKRR